MIAEVDTDNSKTVVGSAVVLMDVPFSAHLMLMQEFNEFLEMMKKLRQGAAAGAFSKVVKRVEKITKLGGTSSASAAETTHSFSDEETIAFADWINFALADDPDLTSLLPIKMDDNASALFKAVRDGYERLLLLPPLFPSADCP